MGRGWADARRNEEQVKNIFDLWRENGCKVPFRATRGWSAGYYVTVVAVYPKGRYGKVIGYGNRHCETWEDFKYWGIRTHPVEVANAGCYGWSMLPLDEKV